MTARAPWLADMSGKWQEVPAKALFRERREHSSPTDVHLTPSQTYGVIPQTEFMRITGNRVVLNLESPEKMKHVEADDFVIHLRSFQGGIEHARSSGKVSVAYTVLVPKPHADPQFYRWVLKSAGYIQELRVTTNQLRDGQSIKFGQFASVRLPMPPVREQQAIAEYLDRETARIDTLIEKQEKLIETLRERLLAMIDSTIAKGTVAMSECGRNIEWNSVTLRRVGTSKSGAGFPHEFQGQDGLEFPFFKVNALGKSLSNGVLTRSDDSVDRDTAKALRATVFPPGTLVYAKVGAALMLGRIRILETPSCLDNNLAGFIPDSKSGIPRFLYYAMSQIHFKKLVNPGAVPSLSDKYILNHRLKLPSLPEQQEIVDFLDWASTQTAQMIKLAERFIELTKERRAALITAAVTGQIDVSEEAVDG